MLNFKLIGLSILLAACSNTDDSATEQANIEPSSVNESIDSGQESKGEKNTVLSEQEDDASELYAQLPPAKGSTRELPADSGCNAMNQYLGIHTEIIGQTDTEVTYKVTATNNAAFPIKEAGGAIQVIETKNSDYACDSIAWLFSKEDGSAINPGESVQSELKAGKKFQCSSDFISDPDNGYAVHYVQGFFNLIDDTQLTTPSEVNCTYKK